MSVDDPMELPKEGWKPRPPMTDIPAAAVEADQREALARDQAEFDGRPWMAMAAADRTRYLQRADRFLAALPHLARQGGEVTIERIEMVTNERGYEEDAEPVWRIELAGICADFHSRLGAQTFANAINALSAERDEARREREAIRADRLVIAEASRKIEAERDALAARVRDLERINDGWAR